MGRSSSLVSYPTYEYSIQYSVLYLLYNIFATCCTAAKVIKPSPFQTQVTRKLGTQLKSTKFPD